MPISERELLFAAVKNPCLLLHRAQQVIGSRSLGPLGCPGFQPRSTALGYSRWNLRAVVSLGLARRLGQRRLSRAHLRAAAPGAPALGVIRGEDDCPGILGSLSSSPTASGSVFIRCFLLLAEILLYRQANRGNRSRTGVCVSIDWSGIAQRASLLLSPLHSTRPLFRFEFSCLPLPRSTLCPSTPLPRVDCAVGFHCIHTSSQKTHFCLYHPLFSCAFPSFFFLPCPLFSFVCSKCTRVHFVDLANSRSQFACAQDFIPPSSLGISIGSGLNFGTGYYYYQLSYAHRSTNCLRLRRIAAMLLRGLCVFWACAAV
ncbi:hypothetical protein FN846DRAFT_495504 [Sphaerosporella brunnea]|uniref:Uncharacterized protein n=1 Tax=Sphaerosporella brunnea TaxID=1250544 RepID=A0A5J5F3U3_9PEZI|nr:hypothetical protein FN846DRAFT_495504 [Sphaerosporella brunnea]